MLDNFGCTKIAVRLMMIVFPLTILSVAVSVLHDHIFNVYPRGIVAFVFDGAIDGNQILGVGEVPSAFFDIGGYTRFAFFSPFLLDSSDGIPKVKR